MEQNGSTAAEHGASSLLHLPFPPLSDGIFYDGNSCGANLTIFSSLQAEEAEQEEGWVGTAPDFKG